MHIEGTIDLQTYLEQAPDPAKDSLRFEWHLERYLLAKGLVPGGVAADVGCGLGFGCKILAKAGLQVAGFDINQQVIGYNLTRISDPRIRFAVHDIGQGPLPGGPFDLICMFEVVEHLEDPGISLQYLKSSLTPNGLLMLSTPNNNDGTAYGHPHHVFEYDLRAFDSLLSGSFSYVERYSQGRQIIRKEYLLKAQSDKSLRALRKIDFLQMRRLLPNPVRQLITDKRVGMSFEEVQREKMRITKGWATDAAWLLAACS